ncbi:MAG: hypothetical protein RI897_2589 [Verrucomicrobiota bacterium]
MPGLIVCGDGFGFRAGPLDDEHTGEDAEAGPEDADSDGFLEDEPAEEDGDDGVDVGVGGEAGGGGMFEEPDIGAEADPGAEDHEVGEGGEGLG